MRKGGSQTQDNSKPSARGARAAKPAAGSTLRGFSQSLPMSLLRAREAVMVHFRAHLNGVNLTEQQWRVLRALTATESTEVQSLAKAAFLLGPSLSRILKDLEARGLVVRRVSKEDMRRGNISISATGRRLVEEAGVRSEAIYAEITRRYGAENLAALQAMLGELEAVLTDPIPDEPVPRKAARHNDAKPRAKRS